jgi:mitogen-activated protein kinase kinase kinase 1
MDAKKKRLRPKLDRRNAIKNIEYNAPPSSLTTSPFDGDHTSPPPGLRSRSLELFPFSENQTSFRVKGVEGEFDLICRSLGLSGPEDFAIPTAAWEAHTARSSSDISFRSRLGNRSSSAKPEPHSEFSAEFQARVGLGAGDSKQNRSHLADLESSRIRASLDSVTLGPSGGIKGARPPVMLRPLVDNILKSFAPPQSDTASNEEVSGGIGEGEDSEEGARLGETDCRLESSSSGSNYNDNGDHDVVVRTSSVISASSSSPSGKFRRRITSWQKGELLGSGSFGTVYEGFTE